MSKNKAKEDIEVAKLDNISILTYETIAPIKSIVVKEEKIDLMKNLRRSVI